MPPFRIPRAPLYQNTGSVARDHLANERTFLSWLRTGLGFIALGIAIERFSQLDIKGLIEALKESSASSTSSPVAAAKPSAASTEASSAQHKDHVLPSLLLGSGTGSIVYGVTRYFETMRHLERGLFRPAYYGTAGMGIIVAGMAGISYWGALRREEVEMERRPM